MISRKLTSCLDYTEKKLSLFLCDAIITEAVLTLFMSQKPGPELVEEGTWLRVVVTALSLSLSLFLCLGTHFPYTISSSSPHLGERRAEHPFSRASLLFQTHPFPNGRPTVRQGHWVGMHLSGCCWGNRLEVCRARTTSGRLLAGGCVCLLIRAGSG